MRKERFSNCPFISFDTARLKKLAKYKKKALHLKFLPHLRNLISSLEDVPKEIKLILAIGNRI